MEVSSATCSPASACQLNGGQTSPSQHWSWMVGRVQPGCATQHKPSSMSFPTRSFVPWCKRQGDSEPGADGKLSHLPVIQLSGSWVLPLQTLPSAKTLAFQCPNGT